jgi:hypothetical protein
VAADAEKLLFSFLCVFVCVYSVHNFDFVLLTVGGFFDSPFFAPFVFTSAHACARVFLLPLPSFSLPHAIACVRECAFIPGFVVVVLISGSPSPLCFTIVRVGV